MILKGRYYKYYFLLISIFITNLSILLLIPHDVLFNVDELEMSFSVADRFAGIPPTSLAWPGGFLQLLGIPIIIVRWLISSGSLSPSSFADFISNEYRNPWNLVLSIRLLVTLIYSVGISALVYTLLDKVHQLAAFAALALFASTPEMWQHSHMAVGNAASIGLAAAAVSMGLRRPIGNLSGVGAGLLFGLAMATKITILLTAPLVLAVAISTSERQRSEVLRWTLGASVGFLLACPYLWVDPVRLAKSIVGNALRPGTPAGFTDASVRAIGVVGIPLLVSGVVGMYERTIKGSYTVISGGLISSFLILTSVSSSTFVFDRYFFPLSLICLYFSAYGFGFIFHLLEEKIGNIKSNFRNPSLFLVLILALFVGHNVTRHVQGNLLSEISSAEDVSKVADTISALNCTEPIAVPRGKPHFTALASPVSLREQLEKAWDARRKRDISDFIQNRGLSSRVVRAFAPAFNEDEQAWIARLSAMSITEGSDVDIEFWDIPSSADRFGVLTKDEMWSKFNKGHLCGAVTQEVAGDSLRSQPEVESYSLGEYWITRRIQ
jgi:hypothetical protein